MKLILGSSSESRGRLIKRMGYLPDMIYHPDIDEEPKKGELPHKLALRLAIEKAQKTYFECVEKNEDVVSGKASKEDFVIISADTVAARGRLILPKALSDDEVVYCLKAISGRRHNIITGVCCIHGNTQIARIVKTKVKFKVLSDQDIKLLVDSGECHGAAGGYRADGIAGAMISWTNGAHISNVSGLPLQEVYKILGGVGLRPNLNFIKG